MGQYLAIGITTQATISKKEMEQGKISQQELIAEMEKQLHFAPDLYELHESGEVLRFTLKQEIFQAQLLPFLEAFYPMVYNQDRYSDHEKTLERLRSTEPSSWLRLAEGKFFVAFQEDRYGMSDTLYFEKDFKPKVRISYKSIMLSAEGKIVMEVYGRQFQFFKYCMAQTFGSFSLAKALRVYITG